MSWWLWLVVALAVVADGALAAALCGAAGAAERQSERLRPLLPTRSRERSA